MKEFAIIGGITAFLLLVLFILIKLLKKAKDEIKVKEASLKKETVAREAAEAEVTRLNTFMKKKEEAQKNADAKKETLHTGDSQSDFNNSLSVLHGAGKNRG
jgi:predicted Holliday junction resolvase-like endonuclease